MFHLFTSNRLERLADLLASFLAEHPLDPFTPEQVVCQSPALASWLNLRLAERLGVVANIQYPLPGRFVWNLARDWLDDLPTEDPFDREVLVWRIQTLLPGLLNEPAFAEVRHYLGDNPEPVKTLQLAIRLADLFDRYPLYRPDLIRAWNAGREDTWQARLWRALVEATGDQAHCQRVRVLDRLLQALETQDDRPLPPRVQLFALTNLPPVLMKVFAALARRVPLHVHHWSPTPDYWGDLVDLRRRARERLAEPAAAHLWSTGNALLAAWGRQGQALQDLILEHWTDPELNLEAFAPPEGDGLLARIQRDIYRPTASGGIPPPETRPPDASLRVAVCHSPLRELQVLRDRLLEAFAEDSLRPEDVLVMIPDMEAYAPYVETVFASTDTPIPYNLSDLPPTGQGPAVRLFLEFLDLPESRLTHSEVLGWLQAPVIARRFGLDPEAIDWLRERLALARPRWGLDASHRKALGLPGEAPHTWRAALARLFAGLTLGVGEPWAGIAPVPGVEGREAEALGSLFLFLEALDRYRIRLAGPHPAPHWRNLLLELSAALFHPADEDEASLQSVHQAIAELDALTERAGVEPPLERRVIRHWLQGRLASEPVRGRWFRGGVTCCGLRPLRGVPFRMICLLGMDDAAFPRRHRPLEFDQMAERWRHGDPLPGEEDRYLFLEALLAARQTLYISYRGRDPRDDSERQPSLPVRELLDYVDARFRPPGPDAPLMSEALICVHPLHPFSPRNFTTTGPGYDAFWYQASRDLRQTPAAQPPTDLDLPTPEAPLDQLDLDELQSFLTHPVRHLLQGRLGLYLGGDLAPPEDLEPFALSGLEAWQARQRVLRQRLEGTGDPVGILAAEGRLPEGPLAGLSSRRLIQDLGPLLETAEGAGEETIERAGIPLAGLDLGARWSLRGGHLIQFEPAKIKGKHLLGFWCAWLALALARPEAAVGARLICVDATWTGATPPTANEARRLLEGVLDLYRAGRLKPLPFAAETAFALARAAQRGKSPSADLQRAWSGDEHRGIPGERDDPYLAFAFRGSEPELPERKEFRDLALRIYGPLLKHLAPQEVGPAG